MFRVLQVLSSVVSAARPVGHNFGRIVSSLGASRTRSSEASPTPGKVSVLARVKGQRDVYVCVYVCVCTCVCDRRGW